MGVELVKKYVIIAIKSCSRSVLRHPFMVIMVFLFIWAYRSFPLLFSLLVYASPVIITTALLLGTLLTFGHSNIPEIPKEGKPDHDEIHILQTGVSGDYESVSNNLKTGVSADSDIVSRDGKNTFVVNNINVDQKSNNLQPKKEHVVKEAKSEVGNQKINVGKEKAVLENHHSQVKPLEAKNDKLRVEEHTDEDNNKGSEIVSDLAESSSPDASIAVTVPMLDELHPLLNKDSQVSQPTRTDAASEHSLELTEIVNESDDYDDSATQEDIEVKDDEEEEEEEALDKEDETAIIWTEDDQKNLMNLGSSERERNQRLENLIAIQRARKNMRMMAENNLVNLRPDLPYSATPILTSRKNPFDLPYGSNRNVPGSAPPGLVPRRNPFDLPYYPCVGGTFQPDPMAFQPNFDVGPSTFGTSRQGRQVFNLGPDFIHEQVASDETNYALLNRQLDELIDSKVSSSPDTESVSSDDDLEYKNHTDDNPSREVDFTRVIGMEPLHKDKNFQHIKDQPQSSSSEQKITSRPEELSLLGRSTYKPSRQDF